MAFASGTASFRRFFIDGKTLGPADDRLFEALNAYAFGKRGSADPTTQTGWISTSHLFDHELTPEKVIHGRFLHLAIRIDKLNVPGNVARGLMRMEEEAALKASGRAFLTKTEQRMAREAGRLRIEQEMKSGAFRRMSSVPLLIDTEQNLLLFGNQGEAAAERLLELFGNTFSRGLTPADVDTVAERMLGAEARALEQVRPFYLTPVPDGFDESSTGQLVDVKFLGREFLTWLWYLIDTHQAGALKTSRGAELAVMIDRTLRLECAFGMTGSDTISADAPAGLPEARAGLAIGKLPTRAGLVLGGASGEFAFTLDGGRLGISGLVIPEPDTPPEDPRVAREERFERCFDCAELVDAVFEIFLRKRVRGDWAQTQNEMSKWARMQSAQVTRRASA